MRTSKSYRMSLFNSVRAIYFATFIVSILTSCKEPLEAPDTSYAFFTAGHLYGSSGTEPHFGIHPPFVDAIPYLNEYEHLILGVLTGDIVNQSTQEYWDSAMIDLNKIELPYHVASGNHDRSETFLSIFGEYYYSFSQNKDLFIILTPTSYNKWNIEGDQKEFLEQTINNSTDTIRNIFLFCHELIWWSPDSIFQNIEVNFRPYYSGPTNYWTEISPFLETLPHKVTIYAGDLGCNPTVSSYMFHQYKNITLIGSGMGGGINDNMVITEIDNLGNVSYKFIGLNNNFPEELFDISTYELP